MDECNSSKWQAVKLVVWSLCHSCSRSLPTYDSYGNPILNETNSTLICSSEADTKRRCNKTFSNILNADRTIYHQRNLIVSELRDNKIVRQAVSMCLIHFQRHFQLLSVMCELRAKFFKCRKRSRWNHKNVCVQKKRGRRARAFAPITLRANKQIWREKKARERERERKAVKQIFKWHSLYAPVPHCKVIVIAKFFTLIRKKTVSLLFSCLLFVVLSKTQTFSKQKKPQSDKQIVDMVWTKSLWLREQQQKYYCTMYTRHTSLFEQLLPIWLFCSLCLLPSLV